MSAKQPYPLTLGSELPILFNYADWLAEEGASLDTFTLSLGPALVKLGEERSGAVVVCHVRWDVAAVAGARSYVDCEIVTLPVAGRVLKPGRRRFEIVATLARGAD